LRCEGFYDRSRSPPAPAVRVRLENPVTGRSVEELFYVDTGFDGTLLLTEEVWGRLELDYTAVDEEVYALHGGFLPVRLSAALARIYLCGEPLGLVKVWAHPLLRRLLLGRGVLNRFYAHLDAAGGRVLLETP